MRFSIATFFASHLLALLANTALASQTPLGPSAGHQPRLANVETTYDDDLFTPLESLEFVSESSFTTLEHPGFPKHRVRIKKSKFCDGTVKYVCRLHSIVSSRCCSLLTKDSLKLVHGVHRYWAEAFVLLLL